MAHVVLALFRDSKMAGRAVGELNNSGFTEDISVIAREHDQDEVKAHQVKQDVSDGTLGGAVTGGILGGVAGMVIGLSSIIIPGAGAFVFAGPLFAGWTVAGAASGAAAGGIVGTLVDAGIPDTRAQAYADALERGEILVAVTAEHKDEARVRAILDKYDVAGMLQPHAAVV